MDLHIQVWKTHTLMDKFSTLKEEFCYIYSFLQICFYKSQTHLDGCHHNKKIHRFSEKIDDSFDVINGFIYVILGRCDAERLHTL